MLRKPLGSEVVKLYNLHVTWTDISLMEVPLCSSILQCPQFIRYWVKIAAPTPSMERKSDAFRWFQLISSTLQRLPKHTKIGILQIGGTVVLAGRHPHSKYITLQYPPFKEKATLPGYCMTIESSSIFHASNPRVLSSGMADMDGNIITG